MGLLQRSGAVYHIPACPGPATPGSARCHARIVTNNQGEPKASVGAVTNPAGYHPADLRAAYNVADSTSTAVIAIVDAYGYDTAEADLAVYRSTFGLPPCTTANGCFRKYNQNGGTTYPAQNNGWAQETALDLDMASAMCPTCKIILVQATSATYANLAAAENTAAALGARVISNSYGGSDAGSPAYEGAYNHPNVAITVSTGDSGYGVQFPASSPHVTAVGGTNLKRDTSTRGWNETTWAGAGSGCSLLYATPSWQKGVTDAQCSNTSGFGRMVADVSAVADPATGVSVYGPTHGPNRGWLVFGGTSVAAPVVAGIYGANGGVATYGSDPYAHTSSLNDVTSGSNGSCGGTYLCTGVAGYDGPTGLGTPNTAAAF